MSGLVYVGRIEEIHPIPEADRIQSAVVVCGRGGKWHGVIQKDQFAAGDLCQVYLQDSLLPNTPEFAFMEKYHWRVRMQRLRGARSEVLIMPLTLDGAVGDDLTFVADVKKYEKPLPLSMSGEMVGSFPTFIPKTDELNFQAAPKLVEALRGQPFYSTVKVNGSSATVFWHEGHFGCCSRNWEMRETPSNAIWRIARSYNLEEELEDVNYALQLEVVGPGIQSNSMGLSKIEMRLFDIYSIEERRYLHAEELRLASHGLKLPMVEIVDWDKPFNLTDEELVRYAEGTYPNGKQREGVVIRPMHSITMPDGQRLSFKVMNLLCKD